jgi:hypothetical protein
MFSSSKKNVELNLIFISQANNIGNSQSLLLGHSRNPTNNLVCIRRINRTTFHMSESLIKLYFKQLSIFQLFSWIKVKVLISFA